MLVGVLELVVGRLERDVRSRSCSVEETERPSGRGGKIPSSDNPDSSSSAPAGCPLTGSTDDGYVEPNVNREGKEWGVQCSHAAALVVVDSSVRLHVGRTR